MFWPESEKRRIQRINDQRGENAASCVTSVPGVVRIFLDENFPLGLERRLKNDGNEVDHVITIGWRGASDARIAERLVDADLLFLTQNEDFLFSKGPAAIIVLSRARQARPIRERIEIWRSAVEDLVNDPPAERRFERMDDGAFVACEEGTPNAWTAKPARRRSQPPLRT